MLLRTRMIMWKEFIQIRRDTRMLFVVVMMPIFMLLVYGYAINFDVKHLRLGIYDQDNSSQSRALISAFSHNEYFTPTVYLRSYQEIDKSFNHGKIMAVLVIPITYANDLVSGRKTQVQMLVDGSDSTSASTAIGYSNAIIQQHSAMITIEALAHSGINTGNNLLPLDNQVRYWYNPELRSTIFLIPGLIALILMMLSALLTSMTVVRERERGTIELLIVSPVMPLELMVGKLLPYVIIAFFDVILIITVSQLIFHIPLVGSPILLLGLASIFLTAALGIGLFISTISSSQQFAMTVAVMGTQLPAVLLSGFIFPVSSMPQKIQWLTNLIPATHFIKIIRGIYLKGNDLSILWQPSLILLLLGIALLTLSTVNFQKKL